MTGEAPWLAPDTLRDVRASLAPHIRATPVWGWRDDLVDRLLGPGAVPVLKLELLQHTGSFKVRGALAVMLDLPPGRLARGVTAVSAGNHAAAVGFAARKLGTSATVVMPKTANPARVALCRSYGAQVTLTEDVTAAFDEARRLEQEEGRTFVHPFEGPRTALGTATLGAELMDQARDLDAVIVPVGGGGLAGGVSAAIKMLHPGCMVYGVEPVGADAMHRSFAADGPTDAGPVETIADSLAPPYTLPFSFELCRRGIDELLLVDDDALCLALFLLFRHCKLAVEPAGAAATAALLGPLRERLAGKRVGLVVCGANIDAANYQTYLARGAAVAAAQGL